MATNLKSSPDDMTPDTIAKHAAFWRRRAAEFITTAKATKDATEKLLATRSASNADALAAHFERALAEVMTETTKAA